MTWKEILPGDAKPGDYIDINGVHTRIVEMGLFQISFEAAGTIKSIDREVAEKIGVRFAREIEDHPHGLIPTEDGVVIRIPGLSVIVAEYDYNTDLWFRTSDMSPNAIGTGDLQEHADERGFEVLWPKPEVEITDEMIDRAARALSYEMTVEKWDDLTTWEINRFLKGAMVALEAALGEHICHQPSGYKCIHCGAPAGTLWGRYWCPDCDSMRLAALNKQFFEFQAALRGEQNDE